MLKTAVPTKNPIREIDLENGLTVRFYDHTRHYYGDFYLVKLEIHCLVPLRKDYFPRQGAFDEARALLGETAIFRRTLERMGVPAAEVGRVIDGLVVNYEKHSLAYVASPSFPLKLVVSQLNKARRTGGFIPGAGASVPA